MAEWIDVDAAAAIGPGEYRVVDVDDVQVAVFNLDGEFFAIEDVCTHDGGELTGGPIEACDIVCPRHGARFDIRTGAVTAPPAYEGVYAFPLRIHNGVVQVKDDRWD